MSTTDQDVIALADMVEQLARAPQRSGKDPRARELLRKAKDTIIAQRKQLAAKDARIAELEEQVAGLRELPAGEIPAEVIVAAAHEMVDDWCERRYPDACQPFIVPTAKPPRMTDGELLTMQQAQAQHARDVRSDRSKKKKPNKTKVDDYRKPGGEYLLPDSYEYDESDD